MEFSLQDIGGGAGWGSVSEDTGGGGDSGGGTGILSALEGVATSFAAGAAGIGLQSIARSQGVTPYGAVNPGVPASLLARPTSGNPLLILGLLVVGGALLISALRRKD